MIAIGLIRPVELPSNGVLRPGSEPDTTHPHEAGTTYRWLRFGDDSHDRVEGYDEIQNATVAQMYEYRDHPEIRDQWCGSISHNHRGPSAGLNIPAAGDPHPMTRKQCIEAIERRLIADGVVLFDR